jgi:hypothetical protein
MDHEEDMNPEVETSLQDDVEDTVEDNNYA